MQQDGIQHAEDDDVGSDAESEGDEGGCSESRRALQLAEGVADVATEAIEGEGGIGGEGPLALDDGIAEAEASVAPGVFGRHAGGNVVQGAEIDVGLELGVDVAMDAIAGEEVEEAAGKGHECTHA